MNRMLRGTLLVSLVLAVGMVSWQQVPIAQEKTGTVDSLQVSKLDSSSSWKCRIDGRCTGDTGLCCVKGIKSHLQEMTSIEGIQVDKTKGLVTLTIKEGEEVNVKDIQKALGRHWTIKSIEKEEEEAG